MASPLLTYYGDDFTGSTDALEPLSAAGYSCALFLRRPSEEEFARFGALDVVGLAGESRSQPPAWMDAELAPTLAWLKSLGAKLNHYKVCSTFDSSPEIGSIGRAIDIGAALYGDGLVPLIVGVPQLRRFTMFGTHFAAYLSDVYRLDRHPVMSRHPVTPMREADLAKHLSLQTQRRIGLVNMLALASGDVDALVDQRAASSDIVLFDVSDADDLLAIGRQLLRLAEKRALFIAGSSGVEYALLSAWRAGGKERDGVVRAEVGSEKRIAVVSGSCSEVTARQIRLAEAKGFVGVKLDVKVADAAREDARALAAALSALSEGKSAIVYTALGPESAEGGPQGESIGTRLGRILRRLVDEGRIGRAIIAGGDTASHAMAALDALALTVLSPWPSAAGAPLCRVHRADGKPFLEIALKGGQIGGDDYFSEMVAGGAP